MTKSRTEQNQVHQTGLYWPGKRTEVEKVILPFQTVETINESKADRDELTLFRQRGEPAPGWRNKLIWGDNKYIMASLLPEFAVNLIYLDPPFATGADFSINIKLGDLEWTKEASVIEEKAYRDTWGRGLDSYLQMMYDRLVLMRELLADNGSIYVHLDWHVGQYVKVIMDEVFGKENFRNEIVWCYGGGGAPRTYYHRKHDLLYWYTKSDKWIFNLQYRPYTEGTLQRGLTKVKGPNYKLREEGAALDDWWTDITKILSPTAYENLKFPTQKPEALLERIIKASSNEGDLVFDPFCGSGTAGAVAEKLGRRWIMADLSKFAIHVTRKRLLDISGCKPFEVLNLGKYQKAKLKENGISRYLDFILKLYRAEPLSGYSTIHGKKAGRMVHIGDVDSMVTLAEIRETAAECAKIGARALDILGWDLRWVCMILRTNLTFRRMSKLGWCRFPRKP